MHQLDYMDRTIQSTTTKIKKKLMEWNNEQLES